MRVIVTEGTHMTNPIGDGRDYGAGEALDVNDATAEAWIDRGWVRPSLSFLSLPEPDLDDDDRDTP